MLIAMAYIGGICLLLLVISVVTDQDLNDLSDAADALRSKTDTVVDLLNTLLPPTIVDRLLIGDIGSISEAIDGCTILMTDIVQFTRLTEIIGSHRVHDFLNIRT